MGLDNGLILRPRKEGLKAPKYIEKLSYAVPGGLYEVAYWRRYWRLRGDIFGELTSKEEIKLEGFGSVIPVSTADLIKIYPIVRRVYSSPANFRKSNNNYWWWGLKHYLTFNIWQGVKILRAIKWVIKHSEDVEVFFYDSY